MRYVFIVNPVAGKGLSEQTVIPQVEKYFAKSESDYGIYITKHRGDAGEIAKKEAESGKEVAIFACGGDGTVFETLNGCVGYDNVSLGVVPTGSANDFLKFFDAADRDAFLSVENLVSGEPVPVDLIKCGDYYCLNICSAGMDAVVADDMALFKNWPLVSGPMAYKLSIVKTFLRKIGMQIKIKIDGELHDEGNFLFTVCANGPCYGGGYRPAPNADPFDGKLNFVNVKTISKLKVPAFLSKYKNGDVDGYAFCETGKCDSMEIISDKEFPVNLDGEIMHFKDVEFSIVKNGAKFVVPASVLEKHKNKILTNLKY